MRSKNKSVWPNRSELKNNLQVVVRKRQSLDQYECGFIVDIYTNSEEHPHGILVELHDGTKGRVIFIMPEWAQPKINGTGRAYTT